MGQHMSQQMKLAPRMIQSMEILVLNQQQLEERISEELEENVTLERSASEGSSDEAGRSSGEEVATGDEAADAFDPETAGQQELVDLTERYEQLQELQQGDFWCSQVGNSPGPPFCF